MKVQFKRDLVNDENDIINMYRDMDPVHKSIIYSTVTDVVDAQIDQEENDDTINGGYLYYLAATKDFLDCDFISLGRIDHHVVAVRRDMEYAAIFEMLPDGRVVMEDSTTNVEEVYIIMECALSALRNEDEKMYRLYRDSRPVFQQVGELLERSVKKYVS